MKETQQHISDHIINVRTQEQESHNKLIGRLVPQKGHTLWEVNMEEETIQEAQFKDEFVEVLDAKTKQYVKRKQVIHKPNCCYVSCLNKKNIPKHLKRYYGVEIELNE